jgi:hypothetical protein
MVALSELFNLSPEALAMRRRDALANMPPTEFINPPVDPFQLAAFKPPGRPRPGDIRGGQRRFIQDAGGGGGIGAPRTSPVPQVGKRQVLDVELGGRATGGKAIVKGPNVEVTVNPSRRDVMSMLRKARKSEASVDRPFDAGQLRWSRRPDTKEVYIWDATSATHQSISEEISSLPSLGNDTGHIFEGRDGEPIVDMGFGDKGDINDLITNKRTTGETFPGAEPEPPTIEEAFFEPGPLFHGTRFQFKDIRPNAKGDIWLTTNRKAAEKVSTFGPSNLVPEGAVQGDPRVVNVRLDPKAKVFNVDFWNGLSQTLAEIKASAKKAGADVVHINSADDPINRGEEDKSFTLVLNPKIIIKK